MGAKPRVGTVTEMTAQQVQPVLLSRPVCPPLQNDADREMCVTSRPHMQVERRGAMIANLLMPLTSPRLRNRALMLKMQSFFKFNSKFLEIGR